MTPDLIALFIIIFFLIICFTHYKALKIGFEMGSKTDFTKIQSTEKTKKSSTIYKSKPDPLDEEMLDFE